MAQMGLMARACMMVRPAILGVDIAPDADPAEVAVELQRRGELPTAVPASPLKHTTGLGYAASTTLVAGGSVVTLEKRSFDPHQLLSVVERRRVTTVAIVGDAFALPIVRALDEAAGAGRTL